MRRQRQLRGEKSTQRITALSCPLPDLSHSSKKKKKPLKGIFKKQTAAAARRGEPAPGRGREVDAKVLASSQQQGRARAARVPFLFSDAEKSTRGGLGATPRLGATRYSRFFPTRSAGKQIFSCGEKTPAPISPQTQDPPAERDRPRPHGLTPSSPPNAQLGTAHLQLKSFQLTLCLHSDFLKGR